MSTRRVELGLRANLAQFSLLVAINAFVGAMIGLERSTLPLIGRDDFHLASNVAVLSFIVAFGLVKALTNLGAGALAQRAGRRRLLIAGWAVALPVPLLIAVAPSWGWIVAANVLLGVNQGLAWSMTVVMKIDLVGPRRRGLALGLNEAAGYGGVALAAGLSGWLATQFAARDVVDRRRSRDRRDRVPDLGAVRPRHRRPRRPGAGAPPPRRRRQPAPAARGVRAGELPRAGAALLLAGRPRQQPQRRPRLGAGAAVPRRPRRRGRRRSDSSPPSTRASGASPRSPPATGRTRSGASR